MPRNFISLPKAEVHVHLEGTFEIDDIVGLAEANNVPLPRPKEQLFQFPGGLAEFLTFLDWSCGLVKDADQMATVALSFSRRMAASGTCYADAIINPTHWCHWCQRIPELIEALDVGFKAAERDGLTPVGLCISLLRQQTSGEAIDLVDTLARLRHPRVVALSIDGNEAAAGRTGSQFAAAFRRAGEAGLKRTVHAGESSGPEGVWDALELLGADRIDHGVRAIEDPALVEVLAKRQIPLGICPTSNVMLGLYPSLKDHPIERLRLAGVPVSVNTDDPALLRVKLEEEYVRCADTFNWSNEDVRTVARTSIEASFAGPTLKKRLTDAIAAWEPA